MKKIISLLLVLVLSLSMVTSSFASSDFNNDYGAAKVLENNKDYVIILKDNDEVRVVKARVDGEEAISTFYKKSGKVEINEKGEKLTVSIKDNKVYSDQISSKDFFSPGELISKESVYTMGYKMYYNDDDDEYIWKLNGEGYFSSRTITETSSNERKLENFKSHIDTSAEYWSLTKGALIGAGAAGVVSAALFLLPEPVVSKAGATAALVAAGASASAALAAGGTYYVSRKYYQKAKEAYDRF